MCVDCRITVFILLASKYRMKQLRIRELINSFTGNFVSGRIRASFASWFLEHKDVEEKERAMEDMWDEMCLEREQYDSSELLPDSGRILKDAKFAENPSEYVMLLKWKRRAIIYGAIACLGLVLTTVLFLADRNSSTTILASAGSKARFELPDGSSVWLNRHSTLSYSDGMKGKIRKVSLDGEAFFDVSKDPEHPFVVSSANMDVKVLGTRFTFSAYPDDKESVYLESGKVCLHSDNFFPMSLVPGEAFTYDPVDGSVLKRKENAVNHLSWINDRLEFANTALDEIVTNLEHWYNVKIYVSDNAKDIHLSLTVRQEPLTEILDAISRISGLNYTINGNEITIR